MINPNNFFPLQIFGKCEFLNPGGSVKDRVAVQIIEEVNSLLVYFYFIFFPRIGTLFCCMDFDSVLDYCAGYKSWTATSRRNCY